MTIINVTLMPGAVGTNGKSAYQEWLDLGNQGSPQNFIDSLLPTQYKVGQIYQFLDGAIPSTGVFIEVPKDVDLVVDPSQYPLLAPYLADVEGVPLPGVETQGVSGDFASIQYLNGWNTDDIGADNIAVTLRGPQQDPQNSYYQFTILPDGSNTPEIKIKLTSPKRLIKAFTGGPNISTLMAAGYCSFENGVGEFANGIGNYPWGGNIQQCNFTNASDEVIVKWYPNAFGPNYVGQIGGMWLFFEGDPIPVFVKGLKHQQTADGYTNAVYAGG
jgi:hypothetical protein